MTDLEDRQLLINCHIGYDTRRPIHQVLTHYPLAFIFLQDHIRCQKMRGGGGRTWNRHIKTVFAYDPRMLNSPVIILSHGPSSMV
jgi:hypothetical protein